MDARLPRVMVTKLRRLKTMGSPQCGPFPIIMEIQRKYRCVYHTASFSSCVHRKLHSQVSPLELGGTNQLASGQ